MGTLQLVVHSLWVYWTDSLAEQGWGISPFPGRDERSGKTIIGFVFLCSCWLVGLAVKASTHKCSVERGVTIVFLALGVKERYWRIWLYIGRISGVVVEFVYIHITCDSRVVHQPSLLESNLVIKLYMEGNIWSLRKKGFMCLFGVIKLDSRCSFEVAMSEGLLRDFQSEWEGLFLLLCDCAVLRRRYSCWMFLHAFGNTVVYWSVQMSVSDQGQHWDTQSGNEKKGHFSLLYWIIAEYHLSTSTKPMFIDGRSYQLITSS